MMAKLPWDQTDLTTHHHYPTNRAAHTNFARQGGCESEKNEQE